MYDIIVIISYFLLTLAFIFMIVILSSQISKSYKDHNKESFYSIILAIIILITCLILFYYFKLITVYPTDVLVILIISILFSFFGIYNLLAIIYKKLKKIKNNPSKQIKSLGVTHKNFEFLRKIFHFIIFFGILIFLYVSILILNYMYLNTHDIMVYEILINFLGPNLKDPLNHYDSFTNLAPASVFLLSFFLVASILMLMNEGARLNNKLHFPFSSSAKLFVREKEFMTFASYIYFAIGMIFSSLLLSTLPILAILATLSFGDSSYALIGKRFGWHKIPFNNVKSIEGSVGGFIITFLSTMIFVGLIYGLIAALIFTLIDIISPRIPICDNIFGPTFITIGYYLAGMFNLFINGPILFFL
ncbi:MAG: hypothetical protein ACTSYZ_12370 [Candidatus Helarchaeota archaeon]